SDTYNEAFEIAAKMYPDDPTANLNAAFCALQRDDLPRAEYYLKKAGDSEEAQYARGILLAKLGKREDARNIFKSLPLMPQARQAEGELNTVIEGVDNPIKVVTTTLP
ncbi:MAG: tetratricopeptide repeat protein, partial [Muribaculaceae bacterium]|nr:tetratricopeptide repeat protein [Muribaculaceae bacterium]